MMTLGCCASFHAPVSTRTLKFHGAFFPGHVNLIKLTPQIHKHTPNAVIWLGTCACKPQKIGMVGQDRSGNEIVVVRALTHHHRHIFAMSVNFDQLTIVQTWCKVTILV